MSTSPLYCSYTDRRSSSIPTTPASLRSRRPTLRLRGENANRYTPLPLPIALGIVGMLVFSVVPVLRRSAIAASIVSGDQNLAAPPVYGTSCRGASFSVDPDPSRARNAGDRRRRRADSPYARAMTTVKPGRGPSSHVAGQRGLGPASQWHGLLGWVHLAAPEKLYPEINTNENSSELVNYIEK